MSASGRSAKQTKFIFVTGGVVSSLGKGLASASIASLLEGQGLKVTIQKLDQLVAQLQRSWLLGGGGAQPQEPKQFSPSQVLP